MSEKASARVIIVGAGLAGLACARRLRESNIAALVLEKSDAPGGRIRTDRIDGFLLDRGFQVYLTAYPEGRRVFDYGSLDFGNFLAGARVRWNGEFHRMADPWRDPLAGIASLLNPIGSISDKIKVARLRGAARSGSLEDVYRRPQRTTREHLGDLSATIVDRFFQPFLGGIFLESDLTTSSRKFEMVFRMFAEGHAALPAGGMEALPRQLADSLPNGSLRLQCSVETAAADSVRLASGETLAADAVVIATDAPEARRLAGIDGVGGKGVHCLYFACEEPPVKEPILVLNGENRGPVNHVCVPSLVRSSYAPAGQHLVSVSVLRDRAAAEADLRAAVLDHMGDWFGSGVGAWRFLAAYDIPFGLPIESPQTWPEVVQPAELEDGRFICGDHRDTGSIQGALVSGRRAADAVLARLGAA